MKKLPDKAEIVDSIFTELDRSLRKDRSKAQACAAIERMIETLRAGYRHPLPDATTIRKAAKNLYKALEPLSGATAILIKGRGAMELQEFRSALDYLENTDGPSPKFDAAKYCAATFAYRLVNEFSQKPPTTSAGGQVREIGTLLYQAFSGEEDVELKKQTDAVCRNRRTLPDNGCRRRRFVRKEGKLHEAYFDEGPGAREE